MASYTSNIPGGARALMKFFKTVGTWGVGTACLLHRLDPQFVVHKSAGFQFLHLHSASAIIVFFRG